MYANLEDQNTIKNDKTEISPELMLLLNMHLEACFIVQKENIF